MSNFLVLFCWYCEPPGLLFPLRAEYILILLNLYIFCNLDQDVLVILYSPQSKCSMTLFSPSNVNAFLIGIGTSIQGGGICAITCGNSYKFNFKIWEAKDIYPSAAFCNPKAIQCNEASMSVAFASVIQELSSMFYSILEVEFSVSAVIVLSSLYDSEEIVSLYESTIASLFCIKLSSGIFRRLSSLWMCCVYSLLGSVLINRGFNFLTFFLEHLLYTQL